MKRKRLSHDSWKCILSKDMHIAQVSTEFFTGHMAFMEVKDITGTQTWEFRGENIVVCDKSRRFKAQDGVYFARYNAEVGHGTDIPLWLFGFLH